MANGEQLAAIGVRRLGLVASDPSARTTPTVIAAWLAELAKLGVRVVNPEAATDGIVASWPTVRETIVQLRGGGRRYAPLFPGFPEQLPDYDIAAVRFTIGACRLLALGRGEWKEAGFAGDEIRAAMDCSDIGWWPASSVPQDIETDAQAKTYQDLLPGDRKVVWIELRIVSSEAFRAALGTYLGECLYANSSLRDEVRDEVAVLLELLGAQNVELDRVAFAETRALVVARLFAAAGTDEAARAQFVSGQLAPDDLLRLFATLTDTDASLTGPVRVPRLTRAQRRLVVEALDVSERRRDVFRRRGLWLTVAKSLHVGEWAERYPRAGSVIAELRAGRRDATSLGSRVEAKIGEGDVAGAIKLLADEAPGALFRQLRRLASLVEVDNGDREVLLAAVRASGAQVPLRVVLAALAQVRDNGVTYPRLAITKRGTPLVVDREAGHLALDDEFAGQLADELEQVAEALAAGMGSWKNERIWIDPATERLLVPDKLRSTSDSVLALERGSRLTLEDSAVLRLFVWWREPAGQRSDLDLSCIALDDEFRAIDQVSWTNLANAEMTHSGDLTSAPAGAAEFIDIRRGALAGKGWRYLAPSIYRFSGPAFGELPEAVAGWMLREKASSAYKTFDIKTVANAFALTGRAGSAIPFVYDIETGDIIYFDAYLAAGWGARVESQVATTEQIGQALDARSRIAPSVGELGRLHAKARGAEIVEDRSAATITVGLDDEATYNALRPQKLLADLL